MKGKVTEIVMYIGNAYNLLQSTLYRKIEITAHTLIVASVCVLLLGNRARLNRKTLCLLCVVACLDN